MADAAPGTSVTHAPQHNGIMSAKVGGVPVFIIGLGGITLILLYMKLKKSSSSSSASTTATPSLVDPATGETYASELANTQAQLDAVQSDSSVGYSSGSGSGITINNSSTNTGRWRAPAGTTTTTSTPTPVTTPSAPTAPPTPTPPTEPHHRGNGHDKNNKPSGSQGKHIHPSQYNALPPGQKKNWDTNDGKSYHYTGGNKGQGGSDGSQPNPGGPNQGPPKIQGGNPPHSPAPPVPVNAGGPRNPVGRRHSSNGDGSGQ